MNSRHHILSGSPRPIFRQDGLSIVELMVAMTIGLVLLGGVMQVFLANKQSYRVQENLGRIQENGRFATDLIARTLRMTAWQGDTPGEWMLGSLSMTNGGVRALSGTNNDTSDGAKLKLAS